MLVVGNQQDTTNDTYKEIPNPKHSETLEQAIPVSDTKKLSNILIKASKIIAKLFRIILATIILVNNTLKLHIILKCKHSI